jgi:lipopolysaccharide biosynthesis regulator YciM
METNSLLVFLLFLSALAIGYLLAKRPLDIKNRFNLSSSRVRLDPYKESLNSWMAEQPDAAIDALTATLDVNKDTLATHMALGTMLRKRGEVDRAIRIHQNILSQSSLSADQNLQARFALAEDYLKAGLFDRAEVLYTELSQVDDEHIATEALKRLVEVYQSEGEWLQAIAAADALCRVEQSTNADFWRNSQAQFFCEIAERAIERGVFSDADDALNKAQALDGDLARTLILRGKLALAEGKNNQAFELLRRVPLNFTAHNAHVLPLLIEAYNLTHPVDTLHGFLAETYQQQPSALLLPAMARATAERQSEADGINFLVEELKKWTHLECLSDVLSILPRSIYSQVPLEDLVGIVEQRLRQTQLFECQGCGYAGHEHHWQCPGCKSWGTVTPVH